MEKERIRMEEVRQLRLEQERLLQKKEDLSLTSAIKSRRNKK